MHVTAIIAAGGRGRRMGAPLPKQLLRLGGRPMLQWSVDAFLGCPRVDEVVVVVPPDLAEALPAYLSGPRLRVVVGGERRQDSVANGFDAAAPESDVIVIHDAARPLVDDATIARTIDAAAESGAAIAAVPARDTIKWSPSPETPAPVCRAVERTLPRESIFLAQTPQAFRRDVLREAVALGRSGVDVTDEAGLAERAGRSVRLVDGSARNIKVTTAEDLAMAEALLGAGSAAPGGHPADSDQAGAARRDLPERGAIRVGSGYDLHRLVEGRPLVLGGVTIPSDRGLHGHSDADVLSHAIIDALLGAAGAGDIGEHFPDTDERWRGASSLDLLARAVRIVADRGFGVVNVDATIVAERPRMAPHRGDIVRRLAEVLGLPPGAISVKAKTNEGVDATGRGEAMAAYAVALLERRSGGGADPARERAHA